MQTVERLAPWPATHKASRMRPTPEGETEPSDDLKTWTLTLRKGVKWSNGDELVTDHVLWNIQRWVNPDVGSSVLGLLSGFMLKDVDTGQKNEDGSAKMTTELWDAGADRTTFPCVDLGELLDAYENEAADHLAAILAHMRQAWPRVVS